MEFVNLTPHTIKIQNGDDVIEVAPSGQIARVNTVERDVGTIGGIPLVRRTFGQVEGLPNPSAGTIYIVSALVLNALADSGRTDVVAPDTGPTAIRNEQGQIAAVTRLVMP